MFISVLLVIQETTALDWLFLTAETLLQRLVFHFLKLTGLLNYVNMEIKLHCLLAQVLLILSCSMALTPDMQYYEPFCLRTRSVLSRVQCTFLRRSAGTESVLFYWSVWTAEQRAEECLISAEAAVTQHYISLCAEERAWGLNENAVLRPNISLLLELGSPCKFGPTAPDSLRLQRDSDSDIQIRSPAKTRQKRAWIVPGTLWCGQGSSARDYQQLGMFENVDKCCREHDHCDHIIPPFTVNFGAFNPTPFTISHCGCDHRFKQCLLDLNDTLSNMVGYTFFNILKLRCIDLLQKKHCTRLNWFGMCTSVKVAPFAVFKNPTSYNPTSHLENNTPADLSDNKKKSSVRGKKKNIKHKRKQSKEKESYDQVTSTRGDNIFMSERMEQQYDKTKKKTRTTTSSLIQKTLLSSDSATLFHVSEPPSINHIHVTSQARSTPSKKMSINRKKKTASVSSTTQEKTMQRHKLSRSKQSFDSQIHKASRAKGFSAQQPKNTASKKMHTNQIIVTTSQSPSTTIQPKTIQIHNKRLKLKQNCDSIGVDQNNRKQTNNIITKDTNLASRIHIFKEKKGQAI